MCVYVFWFRLLSSRTVRVDCGTCLFVFAYLTGDGRSQCFADAFDWNSVKNLLKESAGNHTRCFFASEASTACVENLLFVDWFRPEHDVFGF